MLAAAYARESGTPYFGVCLGMQLAVVEFARNALGYEVANTTETDPRTPYPVFDLVPDQARNLNNIGGTLRLGGYDRSLRRGTRAYQAYGADKVRERHWRRYEFNNRYMLLRLPGCVLPVLTRSAA